MASPTDSRSQALEDLARRHGFGIDAVRVLEAALARGNGTMAQFDHPELGGSGQWMRGGMLMISDMFNDSLKARVAALFADLQGLPAPPPVATRAPEAPGPSPASWWPADLEQPSSTGAQDRVRYAVFTAERRLAVDRQGAVTVYDTGDHRIHGVSQQQGGSDALVFTSQHGTVPVDRLPVVSPAPAVAPKPRPRRR